MPYEACRSPRAPETGILFVRWTKQGEESGLASQMMLEEPQFFISKLKIMIKMFYLNSYWFNDLLYIYILRVSNCKYIFIL